MVIHYWSNAIFAAGSLITSMYIYGKSTNYAPLPNQKILSVLWCFIWALLDASNITWMPLPTIRVITCTAFIFFIWKLCKSKLETALSAYLLSYGISYCLLNIVMAPISIVFALLFGHSHANGTLLDFNAPVYLFIAIFTAFMQFLLAYLIFKIRRFKNGFPFLFERYTVIIALIVAGVVLTFVSLVADDNVNDFAFFLLIIGIIITGVGIYIWIRRGITRFHRIKILLRNIEFLEQELSDEKNKNKDLSEKYGVMRVANHKIIRRFEAMEYKVSRQTGAEYSEESCVTIEDIQKLQKEYQEDVAKIKVKPSLPSTKIKEIDNIFEHFAMQFADNSIVFNLKVNGSINIW